MINNSFRFLKQECQLLKYRLDYLSDIEREKFMNDNGLKFELVSEAEKEALKSKLIGLCDIKEVKFIQTNYYK